MTKDSPKKVETMPESDALQLEEGVRLRAYELYEARGRKDGHDLDDWLRAEQEVTEQKGRRSMAA